MMIVIVMTRIVVIIIEMKFEATAKVLIAPQLIIRDR